MRGFLLLVIAALFVPPLPGQQTITPEDIAALNPPREEPPVSGASRDWSKIYIPSWQLLHLERTYAEGGVYAWQVAYNSLDQKVTGFLARPNVVIDKNTGEPEEKFPAIILCHDGSRGVTQPYRRAAIELAKQGYVVAASSYRGNYGIEGRSQGRREFGKSEVIDVLQLTQLVRKEDYVDSLRMAIIGEGEGGLIVSQAIGRSNVFQAAVLISPYLFSGMPQYGYAGSRDWANLSTRIYGRRISQGEIIRGLRDRDSFRFADKIRTPTLVITHGGYQADADLDRWLSILTGNGVRNNVLRYGGERGFVWSSNPDTRQNAWANIVRWVEAYAPPN